MKINKKSQEETLGFVLIIVIVCIIALIFLAFASSKKPERRDSLEVSNFLKASMYYTTDCAVNYIPQYRETQDLIKECYRNSLQKCLNEKEVCEVLNETLKKIMKESLRVDKDAPDKAYRMEIYYAPLNYEDFSPREKEEAKQDKIALIEGVFANCSSIVGSMHSIQLTSTSGKINIELEICRGK